jgi:hypothetical protein
MEMERPFTPCVILLRGLPYIYPSNEPLAKSSSAADDSEGREIFPCWRYLAMQGNSVWAIF